MSSLISRFKQILRRSKRPKPVQSTPPTGLSLRGQDLCAPGLATPHNGTEINLSQVQPQDPTVVPPDPPFGGCKAEQHGSQEEQCICLGGFAKPIATFPVWKKSGECGTDELSPSNNVYRPYYNHPCVDGKNSSGLFYHRTPLQRSEDRRAAAPRSQDVYVNKANHVHVNIYTMNPAGTNDDHGDFQQHSGSSEVGPIPCVKVNRAKYLNINFHRADVQQNLTEESPVITTVVDWEDETLGCEEHRGNNNGRPGKVEDEACTEIVPVRNSTATGQHVVSSKQGEDLNLDQEDQRIRAQTAEDALRKERESVLRFVLRLEERDNLHEALFRQAVAARPDEWALREAVQRLYSQLHIRLLAIDSGLTFLMDTPTNRWPDVVQQQFLVGDILNLMLPQGRRQDVTWAEVTPCESLPDDVNLRVGEALPEQVGVAAIAANGTHEDGTQERVVQKQLPAPPQRPFMSWPETADELDDYRPLITDMLLSDNGKLVLADNRNAMLKVGVVGPDMSLTVVQTVPLPSAPLRLAKGSQGSVAVTALNKHIFFVDLGHPSKFIVSQVRTAKQYTGVTSGGSENTLFVSCVRSGDGPASIDVIQNDGTLLKTIVDSQSFPDLRQPRYLHLAGGTVLVSDCGSNRVLVLDAEGGGVMDVYTHHNVQQPRQVVGTPDGRCYVASEGGQCVMVRSATGLWSRLLHGPVNSQEPHTRPLAMCQPDKNTLIVAWDDRETSSLVQFYRMPATA